MSSQERVNAKGLWKRNQDLAEACLAQPFVQGIASGGLDRERFQVCVAQDAYFLQAFARAYARALAKSPDRESILVFKDLLAGVFEDRKPRGQADDRADRLGSLRSSLETRLAGCPREPQEEAC